MLRTYEALLRGNRIAWIERPSVPARPIAVHVALLEEEAVEPVRVRGDEMAQALEAIAASGGLSTMPDPVLAERAAPGPLTSGA